MQLKHLAAVLLVAALAACGHGQKANPPVHVSGPVIYNKKAPRSAEGSVQPAMPSENSSSITISPIPELPYDPIPGRTYNAVASWYGPRFHGRRTASGDVYDMDGLTAAHRFYPFGTKLRVTNPKTGLSCEVLVNDRGPFVDGVDIDISRGASRAIRRLDTGPVVIEELGRDMSYVRTVKTGRVAKSGLWRVQVGSFSDPENAKSLKEALELAYPDVRISQAAVDGNTYNRVQAGRFAKKADVTAFAERLAYEGYETWVVRE